MGHKPARGPGRIGSGQEFFEISRVGSGRAGSRATSRPAGRVGSGQECFEISRVGSDRVESGRIGSFGFTLTGSDRP